MDSGSALRLGFAAAGLLLAGAGCSVDVHDGMGPRVPLPNVSGRVTRAGQPAGGIDVALRTANGEGVWYSSRTAAGSVLWNGLGSEGAYAGRLVDPGSYTWRVKFGFADGQEGRTGYRALELP